MVSFRTLGILHICNLRILLRKIVIYLSAENFIFVNLFAVKVNGSDVNDSDVNDSELFIFIK